MLTCFKPGCLYYLSCWYTRKELGVRTTYLYSGSLLSGAFSGLISAGITNNMDGLRGLRAWRWLFLIEGVVTVAVAFVAYFILPNFPRTTSWLNEEETAMAVWRLEEDIGQDDWVNSEQQTFWSGFKDALVDVKMWVLVSYPLSFPVHNCSLDMLTALLFFKACNSVWKRISGFHHQLFPHGGSDHWENSGSDSALDLPALCSWNYYNIT